MCGIKYRLPQQLLESRSGLQTPGPGLQEGETPSERKIPGAGLPAQPAGAQQRAQDPHRSRTPARVLRTSRCCSLRHSELRIGLRQAPPGPLPWSATGACQHTHLFWSMATALITSRKGLCPLPEGSQTWAVHREPYPARCQIASIHRTVSPAHGAVCTVSLQLEK